MRLVLFIFLIFFVSNGFGQTLPTTTHQSPVTSTVIPVSESVLFGYSLSSITLSNPTIVYSTTYMSPFTTPPPTTFSTRTRTVPTTNKVTTTRRRTTTTLRKSTRHPSCSHRSFGSNDGSREIVQQFSDSVAKALTSGNKRYHLSKLYSDKYFMKQCWKTYTKSKFIV